MHNYPTCILTLSLFPPGLVLAAAALAPDPNTNPVRGRAASLAPNHPPANLVLANPALILARGNPAAGLAPATAILGLRALQK